MTRTTRAAALDRLRALLDGDAIASGARLPPERELAGSLGCSRQTLRAGLDALEAEGRLWRHVGQGTFAGPRPRGRPIRDTLLVEATSAAKLMEARLLIEPPIAGAAARRARPKDVAHLRGRAAAGRRARDRPECEQADDAFHRAVAEVAGNPVLGGFLGFLSGARRRAAWQREWERTYRRLGAGEFQGEHSRQHEAIVDAIAAADPDGAHGAMRDHLAAVRAEMARQT